MIGALARAQNNFRIARKQKAATEQLFEKQLHRSNLEHPGLLNKRSAKRAFLLFSKMSYKFLPRYVVIIMQLQTPLKQELSIYWHMAFLNRTL